MSADAGRVHRSAVSEDAGVRAAAGVGVLGGCAVPAQRTGSGVWAAGRCGRVPVDAHVSAGCGVAARSVLCEDA